MPYVKLYPLWLLAVAGCSTMLVGEQSAMAVRATVEQARFDLECPDVESTIIADRAVESGDDEVAEYTIQVRGCAREGIYLTRCPAGEKCNAILQDADARKVAPGGVYP